MTAADRRALAEFVRIVESGHDRTVTATELGEALYGGVRNRQCYARPGGRAARRLMAFGLVAEGVRVRSDGSTRGCFVVSSRPH